MASLDKLTYPSLSKPDYQLQMDALQLALMSMQLSLFRNRQRAVLVVEGPDGAGKGGLLRRALRYMDPRSVRVHPTGAPDERERGQHYLQRFWERLPKPGQISVFDRSWYGRLMIERVENGLHDVERARREIAQFEQMLIDDGILLFKILLYIDEETQRQRLLARLNNPEKHWKLTGSDLSAFQRYAEYQSAFEDLLEYSSSPVEWHLIPANDKYYARVHAMQCVQDAWLAHFGAPAVAPIDPEFEQRARIILER
ncbi:polyphosphate kinase 2 family protein [Spongiibacter tropicus]|uniref:polyphosphate kinase 2 family protein n=1 Tax=Spongiibacter tropicus TaxID=454602 RepID=UPI003A99564C